MRRFFILLLVFLAGGVAGGLLAYTRVDASRSKPGRTETLLKIREEENARLRSIVAEAEQAKLFAANKSKREAVERAVAEIRGLPFKQPVDYNVLSRQQIKETISGKLAEVFTEEEFTNMAAGLAAIGLLPRNYPLRQAYIDLLGEQVAAFYDQHQHKLFMFEDASLDNAQNRVVLAHELTHAMQDQHFGLKKLPLEIKDDDDRAAAAAALVEGEATLVMSEYMLKNLSLGTLKDSLAASVAQNMEQLAKAPRYLREMLIFPYLRGQEFCGALYGLGGYEAISKAYAQPPTSTSQILHPEKFFREPREEPIRVDWSDTTARGQKPIADNVVGELGIRILFSEHLDEATGERAGAGWRGDRYLCFEGGRALVWKSVWADAGQAAEFAGAVRKSLEKRHQLALLPGEGGAFSVLAPRFCRVFSPRPAEVIVVDAESTDWGEALVQQFGTVR
jgi:uncharacterized membrane protein